MFTEKDMESLQEVFIAPYRCTPGESYDCAVDGCYVCSTPCGQTFCSQMCLQRYDAAMEQGYYDV